MKYVLSDIHGNLNAWTSIHDQIKLKDSDELYILGDVIDRHPQGIAILRQIMEHDNMYMILGNHEYMMLEAIGYPYDRESVTEEEQQIAMNNWFHNGGAVTYDMFKDLEDDVKTSIINYLRTLPLNMETVVGDTYYRLCHATIEEIYDLLAIDDQTKAEFCVWDRETIGWLSSFDGMKIIYGHTPTINMQAEKNPLEVYENGSIMGIDCGAGFPPRSKKFKCEGRLSCVCLDNGKVFYSK